MFITAAQIVNKTAVMNRLSGFVQNQAVLIRISTGF
jgi:hypothetical protein